LAKEGKSQAKIIEETGFKQPQVSKVISQAKKAGEI
jgi:hypothetical protein